MAEYKPILNPFLGTLQLVPTNTVISFKEGVANVAALPATGNTLNDGRITANTGFLYVWNGTSWVSQGDVLDVDWSALTSKPSSSVADIDSAVSLKHTNSLDHTQGTDQGLDTGGANAVTVADVKDAVTKKHTQNTDTGSNAATFELTGNLKLPISTATTGIIYSGTNPLIHNFGTNNLFLGIAAGNLTLTGNSNTGIGNSALKLNTSGNQNNAFGRDSLAANTTGNYNNAFGYQALKANTTANYSSAFGYQALQTNTTGFNNNAFGYRSLGANTTGSRNGAFGNGALYTNSTGVQSNAFGSDALYRNTTGNQNNAFGFNALYDNTTADGNNAFGYVTLNKNTTGAYNCAFGSGALQNNTTGTRNCAFGNTTLNSATGSYNSSFGYSSGLSLTVGNYNTFIGHEAGNNILQKVNAINSVAIGNGAYTTKDNQIVLGASSITETILRGNVETDGELKIKCYSQDTEPTLGADQRLAMWIDTNDNYRVYLIFRRNIIGSGLTEQVKSELA